MLLLLKCFQNNNGSINFTKIAATKRPSPILSKCFIRNVRDEIHRSSLTIGELRDIRKNLSDVQNQRKLVDAIGRQVGVKDSKDWYQVSKIKFMQFGGERLLLLYNRSMHQLLSTIYPEHQWDPFAFRGFASLSTDVDREIFKQTEKALNIQQISDWYKFNSNELLQQCPKLFFKYGKSTIKLLSTMYPDYEWLPWKFSRVPNSFWDDLKHQKAFIQWVAKELGIKNMTDWYNVPITTLREMGGDKLVVLYNGSMHKLLSKVIPEYEWVPWKFKKSENHFWENIDNQKNFMKWAGEQLGFKEMDDWYNISAQTIQELGGNTLLALYNNSPTHLLTSLFPEHNWLPWKFYKSSKFWGQDAALTNFMERVTIKRNMKDLSEWYNISAKEFIDFGGGCYLTKFDSLSLLIAHVYPNYKWEPEKFKHGLESVWEDEDVARYFVEWLKTRSEEEIKFVNNNMAYPESNANVLLPLLLNALPNYKWGKIIAKTHKKSQFLLKQAIEQLFRGAEILEDYRHPDIKEFKHLELDFFLPRYNLAFEFHGEQHYSSKVHRTHYSLEESNKRDDIKIQRCKELGITLIIIPYWWDRRIPSIAATVYLERPNLFSKQPVGTPIPKTEPVKDTSKSTTESQVAPLMTATEMSSSDDPTGWWMTEKYDGVRLYWDGSKFLSRNGGIVSTVPREIIQDLPKNVSLDGELWTQYGLYQDAVNLCKTKNKTKWSNATYWVFDTPSLADKPFEERIEYLRGLSLPPFAKVVNTVKCTGPVHLQEYCKKIVSKRGEGVMLREPNSLYKAGRSNSIKKFKPHYDTEVRVVEVQYPHGFSCEQKNGRVIFVNTPPKLLADAKKVQKGAIITVLYNGTNVHGAYQYPRFFRERTDLTWDEVIKS